MANNPKSNIPPIIVIDSREQLPYRFPYETITAKLDSGDYSVKGMETRAAIERKTKSDLFSSIGNGRARFEREMERLSQLEYAALVIEASLQDLFTAPPYSAMTPTAVINTLLAWSIRYGIYVWFAGNREAGEKITMRILEKCWKEYQIEEADEKE